MPARLRAHAPSTTAALMATAVMVWLGLYGFAWTDYDTEAAPALAALVHGDLTRFLQLLPAYGGSLELRAPFALLPGLFGGGELAVYRVVALPCLLAGAALGIWLVARMRGAGGSRLARGVALALCVANPITLRALELGHPEELLGGALCVAAVLLAARGRPHWAGLVLGLAIANKPWALLAFGPVLLALSGASPSNLAADGGPRRLRLLLVAGAAAALFLLPPLIVHPVGASPAAVQVAAQASAIFQPEQVFWFAGESGHVVRGLFGQVKPGYRTPPTWLGGLAHPLIIALAIPLTLLCLRRRRPRAGDALLLLALLLLLRCVLDPWDAVYYPLPFVLALLAWEVTTRREPPVRALAASAAVWAIFVWLPDFTSPDGLSAITMALALPAVAGLAAALYGRRVTIEGGQPRSRDARALSRRSPVPSGTG